MCSESVTFVEIGAGKEFRNFCAKILTGYRIPRHSDIRTCPTYVDYSPFLKTTLPFAAIYGDFGNSSLMSRKNIKGMFSDSIKVVTDPHLSNLTA